MQRSAPAPAATPAWQPLPSDSPRAVRRQRARRETDPGRAPQLPPSPARSSSAPSARSARQRSQCQAARTPPLRPEEQRTAENACCVAYPQRYRSAPAAPGPARKPCAPGVRTMETGLCRKARRKRLLERGDLVSLKMGRLGLMLVAAGLLTITGGAAAVYAQSTTTVVMAEFTFTPDQMVVPAGRDTFVLQNTGQFPHNVHIEGNGVSVDVSPDPIAGGSS